METKENKIPLKTRKLAAKAYALSLVAIASGSVDEEETAVVANMARDEAIMSFLKLFPDEENLPSTPADCIALAQKYTKRVKGKK